MPDPMDKFFDHFGTFFIAIMISGLVMTGVVIWAIVSLVSHFT